VELEAKGFLDCNGIVRDGNAYPWHDDGFRTPEFSEMVIHPTSIMRGGR
jgi:1,4-alpha-glucan branching enzyme